MNKLVACGFALVASIAVASPNVVDLTAQARAEKAYTAAESSVKSNAGAEFDGNNSKSWYSNPSADSPLDQWVQIQFKDTFCAGKCLCPRSYAIYYDKGACGDGTSTYPRKLPKSWTFEGSNDGETWTVLDSHENWNKWVAYTWSEFQIATTDCYRYYRLHMTAICNSNANHQYYVIPELKINGEVFDSVADAKKIRLWMGGASDDWFDAANWTVGAEGAMPPQAGDDVRIAKATTIRLTNSTPVLKALALGGSEDASVATTLVCSNWTTCVSAETVEIGQGGKLTCSAAEINGGDYTDQSFSRVFISCGTLTLATGASIDVEGLGWRAKKSASRGFGPGSANYNGQASISPSHGGHGGNYYDPQNTAKRCTYPYGDAAEPTTAGSSGGSSGYGSGGKSGGGVVRIVATGAVTIDGTVSANGVNAGGSEDQPGSGGSVWISCQSLAGGGTITANGGNGYKLAAVTSRKMLPAGGGRIAVDYDTVAQAAADVTGLKIAASSGVFQDACTTHAGADAYAPNNQAGEGTLHFTDATLVDQLIGKGLSGEISGLTEYTYDGDLDFSYGYVRFAEDGVKVHVKGDLALSGADARLDIGGSVLTNVCIGPVLYAGAVASSLTVDGDLSLEGVSCLDIRAASLSGDPVGATVTVGGTMSVGSGCFVYARSDIFLPSSPRFHVGNLTVAEGGTMTAFAAGGRGGLTGGGCSYRGVPGIPRGSASDGSGRGAGSHGGQGACEDLSSANASAPYDDEVWPVYPGSGGSNANNQWHTGGRGGGVISVVATNGTIRIDGTLNADGEGGNLVSNNNGGGGAGGTILLSAARVFSGATGVLTAKGGTSNHGSKNTHAYCGGGGRISILIGEPYYTGIPKGRVKVSETAFAPTDYPDAFEWLGTVSVAGGQPSGAQAATLGHAGEDGTIRFCHVNEAPGLLLIVR